MFKGVLLFFLTIYSVAVESIAATPGTIESTSVINAFPVEQQFEENVEEEAVVIQDVSGDLQRVSAPIDVDIKTLFEADQWGFGEFVAGGPINETDISNVTKVDLGKKGFTQLVGQHFSQKAEDKSFPYGIGLTIMKFKDERAARDIFNEEQSPVNTVFKKTFSHPADKLMCFSTVQDRENDDGTRTPEYYNSCILRYKNILIKAGFSLSDMENFSTRESETQKVIDIINRYFARLSGFAVNPREMQTSVFIDPAAQQFEEKVEETVSVQNVVDDSQRVSAPANIVKDKTLVLAKCLSQKGVKLYGAHWCSHCQKQKGLFSSEAVKKLNYIECFPDGNYDNFSQTCANAKINAFPTWDFGNGVKDSGTFTLEQIAEKAGCAY